MAKLGRVHHIGYFTDDLEAAIERYGKAFPVDQTVRGESAVLNAKIAFVRSGGTVVELMEPNDKTPLGGKTGLIIHHTAYEVEDIAQAMREMEAEGIRFRAGSPAASPAGTIAYLDDAHLGTPIHLIQVGDVLRLSK